MYELFGPPKNVIIPKEITQIILFLSKTPWDIKTQRN